MIFYKINILVLGITCLVSQIQAQTAVSKPETKSEASKEAPLLPYNHIFFVVRAKVFHGVPEKNRDFSIQFFVQAIFPWSTSLHRPLVLNTIGDL